MGQQCVTGWEEGLDFLARRVPAGCRSRFSKELWILYPCLVKFGSSNMRSYEVYIRSNRPVF